MASRPDAKMANACSFRILLRVPLLKSSNQLMIFVAVELCFVRDNAANFSILGKLCAACRAASFRVSPAFTSAKIPTDTCARAHQSLRDIKFRRAARLDRFQKRVNRAVIEIIERHGEPIKGFLIRNDSNLFQEG